MNNNIQIVKWYFGITTKEAKEYIKNASKETLENIQKCYKNQCKSTFYND